MGEARHRVGDGDDQGHPEGQAVGPFGSGGRAPMTSFVGREREVEAVAGLLRRDGVRLVTLDGPGGVGKTRLALRVAERLAAESRAGRWLLVPLAAVPAADLVGQAIADALGIREPEGTPRAQAVAARLREGYELLVLDNAEHVLDAAPLVGALLADCPALRVLVTSREALRLSAEHVLRVEPMELPAPGAPAGTIAETEAVRLFAERAGAARVGFTLDEANAPAVAEICRRLDGLPLAIELAAARTGHLPVEALRDRLGHRLPLLTGGPRDVPERHRTIRGVISWSYDLLRPEERRLFQRLAVFAGGFTVEAARAVAMPDAEEPEVLDAVASLVAKSLVRPVDPVGGEARFDMLETIREFGLERLRAEGDAQTTRQRHADHLLALAEARSPSLPVPGDPAWLRKMEPEHANARLALEWLAEGGQPVALLRLAGALYELWIMTSRYEEGRAWLERAVRSACAVEGEDAARARCRALSWAGTLALFQGDYDQAAAHYAAELPLARGLGDVALIADALIDSGLLAYRRGDLAAAEALTVEAYRTALGAGEDVPVAPALAAIAIGNLGDIAAVRGDAARAARCYEEAIARCRASGYGWGLAEYLGGLGRLSLAGGRVREAAELFAEGLETAWEIGDTSHYPTVTLGLAGVAVEAGQGATAARLFGAAEALGETFGMAAFPRDVPLMERGLARVRAMLDGPTLAAHWAEGRRLAAGGWLAEARAVRAADALPDSADRPADALTPRERDVLRLLVQGRTDREIAEALFVARRTVTTHTSSIFAKLGVSSRTEAAAVAVRDGLA